MSEQEHDQPNIFERLNAWLDRSEVTWVTFLTKVLPILVPIIPAYQTHDHVHTVLGYDLWIAWVAAAIVEFFGYAAMYKMMQFWFSETAGIWMWIVTILIYFMYLAIILTFNVIPEMERGAPYHVIWMNFLFSIISVPAGALTAISAIHTQREEEHRTEKERRRIERRAARTANAQANTNTQANTEHRTNILTPNTERTNAATAEHRTPRRTRKPNTEQQFGFRPPNEQTNDTIRSMYRELHQANERPPSIREVQAALRERHNTNVGWSTSTIQKVLKEL